MKKKCDAKTQPGIIWMANYKYKQESERERESHGYANRNRLCRFTLVSRYFSVLVCLDCAGYVHLVGFSQAAIKL